MRFHLVVNPVAGRRRAGPLAEAVAAHLRSAGHPAQLTLTRGPGDAAQAVRALPAGSLDRLVVAGGDGTLREVVNGRPEGMPWPVALLPVGTANLVSREVAVTLPRDPEVLARGVREGAPWRVNLLEIRRTGRSPDLAVATVGVGLDAEIVHRVASLRASARAPGTGGYRKWVRPMAAAFLGYGFPVLEATVDGRRTCYGTAVVAQNAHAYGGVFTLVPQAALDADAIHVVVVRSRSRRDLFRLLVGAWRARLPRYHDVRVLRGEEVAVRCVVPTAVQADGDPAGTTDLSVRLRRGGLTLIRMPAPPAT